MHRWPFYEHFRPYSLSTNKQYSPFVNGFGISGKYKTSLKFVKEWARRRQSGLHSIRKWTWWCMNYFVYLLPYFHSSFISILRRYKFIQVIIVHYSYCNSMVVVWNNSVLAFADNCSINEQYTQDDIIPLSFHQSTYHCVDFYKNQLLIGRLWEWKG